MSNKGKESKASMSMTQMSVLKNQVAARNDPVYFGEHFLGMKFYAQQKVWLWATTKTQKEKCAALIKRLGICFTTPEAFYDDIEHIYTQVFKHIFCVSNQAGKTMMTAVKHIWACYFKIGKEGFSEHLQLDDYKTLNISPHSDQSNKCFEYVRRICDGEMIWFDPVTKMTKRNEPQASIYSFITGINNNEKEIRFANGSTFWSKSLAQDKGTSRAGEQFGLITFDEASQSYDLEGTLTPLLSRILRYGFCFDIIL